MKRKILVLIAIITVAVLYAGCGSSYKDAAEDYTMNASAPAALYNESPSTAMRGSGSGKEYDMSIEAIADDFINDGSYGASTYNSVEPTSTSQPQGLKIIYTAHMYIQTTEWDDNYPLILSLIDEFGGYIQNSSVSGGYTSSSGYYNARSANLSIRIPSSNYRAFLNSTDSQISTITSLDEYTDDITAQYVDTEARIKTLKAQEQRLLNLLDNAGDLSDLLEIEIKLGDVRYQIESYQSIMNTYNSLLSYSTININISEVSTVVILKDTFGQRVLAALDGSIKAVANFFDGLVIALIYIAPYAIITLLLVFGIRALTKKKRLARKERKRLAKEQQSQQPISYGYTQDTFTPPTEPPRE